MSKKWLRFILIIAVLAVNLGFTVGAASAQTTYATYTVQRGDTLGKIAAKYCTTWTVIYNLNRNVIYNPNVIYPGMVLTVPLNCSGNDGGGPVPGTCVDYGPILHASGSYSAPYYTVYWGDTLFSIGRRFGTPWQSISYANGLYYPTIFAGQRLTIPCGGGAPVPPPTQPAGPIRINFSTGETKLTTAGAIDQTLATTYVLWGNKGQTMTVSTFSRGDPLVPLVISISGSGGALTLEGPNSQVSNTVTTKLPAAGDYYVTIRPTTTPATFPVKFDITFAIQ